MTISAVNPATGEEIARYEPTSEAAVETALTVADHAQVGWRDLPVEARVAPLRRAASILRERADELARLMALEMGKPLVEGRAEAEKCAWVCDYYAEHAAAFLADEPVSTDAAKSYVCYRPMGIVLAVMPWNFPFWQVFRFAAPALAAGNAALLKHASNVPGCALAIEGIWHDAGLPEGLFKTLLLGSEQVAGLLADPRVRAVSLTGSTPAGQAVAAEAGRQVKKCLLELGGSDPFVVLEDADLDLAAEQAAVSRLINAGQSCIAAKRFIVVDSVKADFADRLRQRLESVVVGDPLAPDTQLGPMARQDLRDELHDQVQRSLEAGARCLLGGALPDGPGAFYPVTLLDAVQPGMPAYDEELFGPVAVVIDAADEAEALRIAADTPFGLGAAVFTGDQARGERIAVESLEAGACFVNAFVRSDPRLPFGGVKASGYGRELGRAGILEFVNVKTLYIA